MKLRAAALLLTLALGLLAAPVPAESQRADRRYSVGAILPFPGESPRGRQYLGALRERLAAHGFFEGRNLAIDARYAIIRGDARVQAPVASAILLEGCLTPGGGGAAAAGAGSGPGRDRWRGPLS